MTRPGSGRSRSSGRRGTWRRRSRQRPVGGQQRAAGVARLHLGVQRVHLPARPPAARRCPRRSASMHRPHPGRGGREGTVPREAGHHGVGAPAQVAAPAPAQGPSARAPRGRRCRAWGRTARPGRRSADHCRRPAPCGVRTPATTWALVTTRSGATTKPLPSWPRPQVRASPVILTMLRAAWASDRRGHRARRPAAATGTICSGATPANTRGNVLPATASRKLFASVASRSGTTLSTTDSTCDDADRARQRRRRAGPQRTADEPEDQRDRDHAGHGAEHLVDDLDRPEGQLLADPPADQQPRAAGRARPAAARRPGRRTTAAARAPGPRSPPGR